VDTLATPSCDGVKVKNESLANENETSRSKRMLHDAPTHPGLHEQLYL
jgi:hypothetical protein